MIGSDPYTAGGYQVLKVETHLHTLHSDGQHSVEAMFEACRQSGYDAVALTDHNTVSGFPEAAAAAADLGLIFLPGVEVTTFHGHVVVLGVSRVPEWRDLEARGLDALADEVHAEGGLVCVSHPAALGSPVCSGCAWEWPVQPAAVDLWEVFSAPRPSSEVALGLWKQRLLAGGNPAPVAAGDVHSTAAAARLKAATYVYATEKSSAAVIEAFQARRVFASTGPRLDFWLQDGAGTVALAGSRVGPSDWTAELSSPATVCEVEVPGLGRYAYAERRDADQQMEAVSASIWIESSH